MRTWPVWSARLRIRTSASLSIWIRPWSPLRLRIRSAAAFRLWIRTGTPFRQWIRASAPCRLWLRAGTPSRQWIWSSASSRQWIRAWTRWPLRIRIQSAATPRPNRGARAKERCGRAARRIARARALCRSTMIEGLRAGAIHAGLWHVACPHDKQLPDDRKHDRPDKQTDEAMRQRAAEHADQYHWHRCAQALGDERPQ